MRERRRELSSKLRAEWKKEERKRIGRPEKRKGEEEKNS